MVPLQLWIHYEREFRKKKQLLRHQRQKQQMSKVNLPPVDMNDSHKDINKDTKFTNPLRNFWG